MYKSPTKEYTKGQNGMDLSERLLLDDIQHFCLENSDRNNVKKKSSIDMISYPFLYFGISISQIPSMKSNNMRNRDFPAIIPGEVAIHRLRP